MKTISKHISWAEATRTSTGLPNAPGPQELLAMRHLASTVFEPLRAAIGEPILVTSFFRAPAVNRKVGGSATSQHVRGEAMDIRMSAGSKATNADLFRRILNHLPFDQLIWEFGTAHEPAWVHVSWRKQGPNRRQALRALKRNGRTTYVPFTA